MKQSETPHGQVLTVLRLLRMHYPLEEIVERFIKGDDWNPLLERRKWYYHPLFQATRIASYPSLAEAARNMETSDVKLQGFLRRQLYTKGEQWMADLFVSSPHLIEPLIREDIGIDRWPYVANLFDKILQGPSSGKLISDEVGVLMIFLKNSKLVSVLLNYRDNRYQT